MPSDVAPGEPARVPTGRLTAQAIRAVRLSQAGHSAGGLSEDDVHTFLEAVAGALEAAEARQASLRAEVERLRAYYLEQGTDVDQPEERPAPPPISAAARLHAHVPELVAAAQRYATSVPAVSAAAGEQMLAQSQRRIWQLAHEVFQPPADRQEAERALRWLDAFVYAMQVQAREAYDVLGRDGDPAS
jgi:cell division septum initiation protein DivIVA